MTSIPQSWSSQYKKELFETLLSEYAQETKDNVEPATSKHISEYIAEANEIIASKGKIRGIATNYSKLDSLLGGLDGGELVVISGSTGTGKTMFALNMLANAYLQSQQLFGTLVFTLEMTNAQLTSRILELVNASRYQGEAAALPIHFYDNAVSVPTMGKVRALAKFCKDKLDLGLIVIDHLHCFARSIGNQQDEIGVIVRDLKKLAIDLSVPIILVSHIRKRPAGSSSKEPEMDDLKGSSFIAQDADIVIMLSRDHRGDDQASDILNVFVDKNRNKGQLGGVQMRINMHSHKLTEVTDAYGK